MGKFKYLISWILAAAIVAGCSYDTVSNAVVESTTLNESTIAIAQSQDNWVIFDEKSKTVSYDGKVYKVIEVYGGDISGYRQSNVAVDIGFGKRVYWALTNEKGQLKFVFAKKVTLQDDANEPVTSKGRYFYDEAKVPGVESKTLDEGHVVADSLGGVSNAYNITPQNSTMNQHGNQAYMEKHIRDEGGCEEFIAVITYPNEDTQIPSHYCYEYTINGETYYSEFDNVDPVEANEELNLTEMSAVGNVEKNGVVITYLDKVTEYIVLSNNTEENISLTGWKVVSVKGNQTFAFDNFVLKSNSTVKIGDSGRSQVDIHWLDGKGVWNNSESDPAELYDSNGLLIDRYEN